MFVSKFQCFNVSKYVQQRGPGTGLNTQLVGDSDWIRTQIRLTPKSGLFPLQKQSKDTHAFCHTLHFGFNGVYSSLNPSFYTAKYLSPFPPPQLPSVFGFIQLLLSLLNSFFSGAAQCTSWPRWFSFSKLSCNIF